MFRKIQLKLTLFYTIVVAVILIATNLSIYFLFTSYNSNQLASETERMLATIQSSEWLYETEELGDDDLDEEDRLIEDRGIDRDELYEESNIKDEDEDEDEDEDVESIENSSDSNDLEKEEKQESEESSDDDLTEEEKKALEKESEEDKKEEEEDKKEEEEEKKEEEEEKKEEENDGVYNYKSQIKFVSNLSTNPNRINTSSEVNELDLPSSEDILVPGILNDFSFYYIYSLDGELVRWKNEYRNLHNDIKIQNQELILNGKIQVYEFSSAEKYYFLMQKMPIVSDGYELGYFVVGRDVSIAYETIDNLGKIIFISLTVGIIISLLLGYLIAGRTIKPIKEAFISKQKFLADASHELRTPISVVLLSADTLEQEIGHDEFSRQVVKDIREEALNMKSLVEKLLHLARHDSANLKIDKEIIELPVLIDSVVNGYRYIAKEKDVVINLNNNTQEYKILGDKNLIHSVFSIVIDNAIKYSGENSLVTVNIEKVTKEKLFIKQQFIKIDVIDTGKGINPKEISNIFNRFYRIETSRSRHVSGHGLGLSIAKEIVTSHHGSIDVKSEIGQGTCFTILLPMYKID